MTNEDRIYDVLLAVAAMVMFFCLVWLSAILAGNV